MKIYKNQLKNQIIVFFTLSIIVKSFKADDWTLTASGDRKQEASLINLSIVIPYMFKKCLLLLQSDDEIKSAEEKFAESLQHAQMGMYHLLENDVRLI